MRHHAYGSDLGAYRVSLVNHEGGTGSATSRLNAACRTREPPSGRSRPRAYRAAPPARTRAAPTSVTLIAPRSCRSAASRTASTSWWLQREEDDASGSDERQGVEVGLAAKDAPVQARGGRTVTRVRRHDGDRRSLEDHRADWKTLRHRFEGAAQAAGMRHHEDATTDDHAVERHDPGCRAEHGLAEDRREVHPPMAGRPGLLRRGEGPHHGGSRRERPGPRVPGRSRERGNADHGSGPARERTSPRARSRRSARCREDGLQVCRAPRRPGCLSGRREDGGGEDQDDPLQDDKPGRAAGGGTCAWTAAGGSANAAHPPASTVARRRDQPGRRACGSRDVGVTLCGRGPQP